MPRHADTIAALSTPAGTAALALIRISGPDTPGLAGELAGAPPPPRTARRTDYRSRAGDLIDEVLLTYFPGPRSYTGEASLEISCHGNPFIVQRILEDLFARGCRPAQAGEFTQRAFLNGRLDLSQAEAVMDVIHARSERALQCAHQQLRGALGRRVNDLIDGLLGVLARVEAYIDFPDEDLPTEDRELVRREIDRLAAETARLLATSHYGAMLRDGIRTVIVGAPNVGKSSLLNRLVGRDRALVSPEPGTTRDYLEERVMVGPHCLRLIDTAGLNPSPAPLEKLGIAKTWENLELADLILLVIDGSDVDGLKPDVLSEIAARDNILIALNKSDLSDLSSHATESLAQFTTCRVSAKTGAGIDELVAAIVSMADKWNRETGEDQIAVSARHAHALSEAREGLARAAARLREASPPELLASELRAVLVAYGEITGKVDNERMLDQLFATFCIGK